MNSCPLCRSLAEYRPFFIYFHRFCYLLPTTRHLKYSVSLLEIDCEIRSNRFNQSLKLGRIFNRESGQRGFRFNSFLMMGICFRSWPVECRRINEDKRRSRQRDLTQHLHRYNHDRYNKKCKKTMIL